MMPLVAILAPILSYLINIVAWDYFDIKIVLVEQGTIWDSLLISTEGHNFHIKGMSAKNAHLIREDVEIRVRKSVIDAITKEEHRLAQVANKINSFLAQKKYISSRLKKKWISLSAWVILI